MHIMQKIADTYIKGYKALIPMDYNVKVATSG
jgi:hypothetical protein